MAALLVCAVLSTLFALRTFGQYNRKDQGEPALAGAAFFSLLLWTIIAISGANVEVVVNNTINSSADAGLVYGSAGMVVFNVFMAIYAMMLIARI